MWIDVLFNVGKNQTFSKLILSKLGSHPGAPMVTSFILITSGTCWYDIRIDIFAPKRTRMYMIQSKFV